MTSKNIFQQYELDAFLGDFADDYDVDAIIAEATEIDYSDGNRYWVDGIDLMEICNRHDLTSATTWRRNEHDELVRGDGSWLEYGAFGHDTYGLHYVGKPDAVYKVYSELSDDVPSGYSTTQDAERIIKAIEEGRA